MGRRASGQPKARKRAANNKRQSPNKQRKRRNEMILRLKSVPKSFKCSIARSAHDFKTKTPLMSLKKPLKTLSLRRVRELAKFLVQTKLSSKNARITTCASLCTSLGQP